MSDIITYLTKVRFGPGAVREIEEEIALLGIARPFIVTDAGVAKAGLVDEVLRGGNMPSHTPVFVDTPENPTEEAVEAALAILKDAEADGIVAVGGGSAIDLAKGVALLATHPGPLEPYAAIRGGVAKIGPVLPLIAVPTTAGTGSEVGRATLITLRNERKLGFVSPHLIPRCAVCDPELARSLPPRLTAATGMDAISHCVETFLSPKYNPPADAIALDGLGRAWRNLPAALADGMAIEPRTEMAMAALQGAMAFQKGLGAVHSTSHALGGLKAFRLHHGTLNAVMMPAVLAYNAPVCAEKYARIRAVLGLPEGADLPEAFERMTRTVGLPTTLAQMGVSSDVIPTVAKWSEEDHSTPSNPRPAGAQDFAGILRAAMG
jgi:alcohol dehydrogenase class IV